MIKNTLINQLIEKKEPKFYISNPQFRQNRWILVLAAQEYKSYGQNSDRVSCWKWANFTLRKNQRIAPQDPFQHTQEAEVNKNALGIYMQHDKNNTVQVSNMNSLFLHLVAIIMSHHYIWINSFLVMAVKVHYKNKSRDLESKILEKY